MRNRYVGIEANIQGNSWEKYTNNWPPGYHETKWPKSWPTYHLQPRKGKHWCPTGMQKWIRDNVWWKFVGTKQITRPDCGLKGMFLSKIVGGTSLLYLPPVLFLPVPAGWWSQCKMYVSFGQGLAPLPHTVTPGGSFSTFGQIRIKIKCSWFPMHPPPGPPFHVVAKRGSSTILFNILTNFQFVIIFVIWSLNLFDQGRILEE
jgi:hypothetical protein